MSDKIVYASLISVVRPSAVLSSWFLLFVIHRRFNAALRLKTGSKYRFTYTALFALVYLIGKEKVKRSDFYSWLTLFYASSAVGTVIRFFRRRNIFAGGIKGREFHFIGDGAALYIGVLLSVIDESYPELARMLNEHCNTELD